MILNKVNYNYLHAFRVTFCLINKIITCCLWDCVNLSGLFIVHKIRIRLYNVRLNA